MQASPEPKLGRGVDPDDTIPTWQVGPGSGTRLAASERPTLPPPESSEDCVAGGAMASDEFMVSRIHLGPSVDEVLYRLSLGDLSGAALANEDLEPCVPARSSTALIVASMDLTCLEEFILATIDGHSTWGEIMDSSPFSPRDTLAALCELVDKGALSLRPPPP
jgi:hypothetical protein